MPGPRRVPTFTVHPLLSCLARVPKPASLHPRPYTRIPTPASLHPHPPSPPLPSCLTHSSSSLLPLPSCLTHSSSSLLPLPSCLTHSSSSLRRCLLLGILSWSHTTPLSAPVPPVPSPTPLPLLRHTYASSTTCRLGWIPPLSPIVFWDLISITAT